ncbi:MAG: alpha/beta hydrolase [Myxococcota bacterium]
MHVDEGAGAPIVFIHGLTATLDFWWPQTAHFAQRHRAIALDLPGFGRSDKPDVDYSVHYFVGVLARFLHAKHIARATLVGNSLGGQVAMAFALAHPRAVSSLVLVSPAGVSAYPRRAISLLLHALALARRGRGGGWKGLPRVPAPTVALLFKLVFPTRPDKAARFTRFYLAGMESPDYPLYLRAALRAMHGVVRCHMVERAGEIAAPTLIVWGGKDLLLPVTAAKPLRRRIPGSRLIVYADAGHCPMIDEPDRFNRDVEEFLAGGPDTAR